MGCVGGVGGGGFVFFLFDAKGEVVGIGNELKRFENGKIVEGAVAEETVEITGTGADTEVTE